MSILNILHCSRFQGFKNHAGYYYEAFKFSAAEHGGTHLDAPSHFSSNGLSNDKVILKLDDNQIKAQTSETINIAIKHVCDRFK